MFDGYARGDARLEGLKEVIIHTSDIFWETLRETHSQIVLDCTTLAGPTIFQRPLQSRAIAPLLGKLAYKVLDWFDSVPLQLRVP